MRKTGIGLVVAAWVLLLYMALAVPRYAHAHPELGPAVIAEYAAPWPRALTGALALSGIMLAAVPLRGGERWAFWTSLAMLIVLLVPRLLTDPRCLVVLDPHQHGCHTFVIAIVSGIVGLVLARR